MVLVHICHIDLLVLTCDAAFAPRLHYLFKYSQLPPEKQEPTSNTADWLG